jgi:hypothetical protein
MPLKTRAFALLDRSRSLGVLMSETVNSLLLEFLTWIASRPRTYNEAMEAWQSHCPRQTIWEDAIIEGLIEFHRSGSRSDPEIALTPRGKALLNGDGDPY